MMMACSGAGTRDGAVVWSAVEWFQLYDNQWFKTAVVHAVFRLVKSSKKLKRAMRRGKDLCFCFRFTGF
jgi:hypothetical protein